MTCGCACHTGGTYKPTCTVDARSSGVPGLPSCSPCFGPEVARAEQAPCIYPGCDDPYEIDGLMVHIPALTKNTICGPCRTRYSKLLFWIIGDYDQIKRSMPSPARRPGDGSKHVSPKAKSFGHPAEWASDAARMIADRFNALEDDLREHRGEREVLRRSIEVYRVSRSYDYITKRFDDLCTFPLADDWAGMLVDMHGKLRSALGLTRFAQHLKTPCPRCDHKTLVRTLDRIDCQNCSESIPEDHYQFWARMMLDEMIDAYDKQEAMA